MSLAAVALAPPPVVGDAAITTLPQVRLLDARSAGLDSVQLRCWAREQTEAADAAYCTRSYRYPYALIAWHDEPVGVDIERVEPCSSAFAVSICTPAERADRAFASYGDAEITSIWSSKEALAKALGDAIDYDPRRLASPIAWPAGRAGRWRAAPLTVAEGHAAWLCWRQPQAAATQLE